MSIVFTRLEQLGWASWPVEYLIEGVVRLGRGATYDDPPEDDDVTIVTVVRIHPVSGDEMKILTEWPFTDDEYDQINQQLCQDWEPTYKCDDEYDDDR